MRRRTKKLQPTKWKKCHAVLYVKQKQCAPPIVAFGWYARQGLSVFIPTPLSLSCHLQVTVKDAVPLFHTSTLTPLLETSATMVDAYAATAGLSIVGFYQVGRNVVVDASTPDHIVLYGATVVAVFVSTLFAHSRYRCDNRTAYGTAHGTKTDPWLIQWAISRAKAK